jgi:hypothetical protein
MANSIKNINYPKLLGHFIHGKSYLINLDETCLGRHFVPFFHKYIRSPWTLLTLSCSYACVSCACRRDGSDSHTQPGRGNPCMALRTIHVIRELRRPEPPPSRCPRPLAGTTYQAHTRRQPSRSRRKTSFFAIGRKRFFLLLIRHLFCRTEHKSPASTQRMEGGSWHQGDKTSLWKKRHNVAQTIFWQH